ncbi:MAG: sugar transferase [candidate division WOR-3 bacterium]|nr:MAG: sugar transferase [candidate division WOR-3 bacterium]
MNDKKKVTFLIYYVFKRIMDIILALVGLTILAPVWVILWIVITNEDGSPVFIKQERIGSNGKHFDAFKFRSMHISSLTEHVNVQANENDTRITKVGKILRNTAIDESPQLINILLGDMSFVGPRPLLSCEVEVHNPIPSNMKNIPGYEQRISVVPGLTGIAQLCMPRDVPRERKFEYDLMYISKRSLLTDVRLILLSLAVTFLGRWEKRGRKLSVHCD